MKHLFSLKRIKYLRGGGDMQHECPCQVIVKIRKIENKENVSSSIIAYNSQYFLSRQISCFSSSFSASTILAIPSTNDEK